MAAEGAPEGRGAENMNPGKGSFFPGEDHIFPLGGFGGKIYEGGLGRVRTLF